MKKSLLFILIILFFSKILISQPPSEYQVKTALIYNFLRFVELEKEKIKDNKIILCSFQGSRINEELKKLDNIRLSDRVIVYREIISDDEIDVCSVLYVNQRDTDSLKSLLENAHKDRILTISDVDGYGDKGVVINMFIQNEKVRFEINIVSAEKANVKISSRLLTLAKIIGKTK